MTQLDMLDVLAMEEDMNDPLRVVAYTTIGLMTVSTVRTPLRDTFETCIFHNTLRYSEVVESYVVGRDLAFNLHQEWVRRVYWQGYTFEQEYDAVLVWLEELKHAGCFDADYLITPQM